MNNELEKIWKEAVVTLRYYPGIFLEGLRKATKNLSRDSQSLGLDLNPGPYEHETGFLITRQRRLLF
jgi:hypothetical protein